MKKHLSLDGTRLRRLAKPSLALITLAALAALLFGLRAYDARRKQMLEDEHNLCIMEKVLATVQLDALIQVAGSGNADETRQLLRLGLASNIVVLDSLLESADPATRASVEGLFRHIARDYTNHPDQYLVLPAPKASGLPQMADVLQRAARRPQLKPLDELLQTRGGGLW